MQFAVFGEVIIVCKQVTFVRKSFQFVSVRAVVMAAFDYEMSVTIGYLHIVQMLYNSYKVVKQVYKVAAVKSASPRSAIARQKVVAVLEYGIQEIGRAHV